LIRIIIDREILDVRRDKKLVVGSIILPLLILPLIGGIILTSQSVHQPVIEIVNQNVNNLPYVSLVSRYAETQGAQVFINNSPVYPDVKLVFPYSFYLNASRINGTVYVYIFSLISSTSQAYDIANNALYNLAVNISLTRIQELARMANTPVNAEIVRSPLYLVKGYIAPGGKPASQGQSELASIARVISFVMFPSVTPVVLFVVDSFAGERERRTLESLLATPVNASDLVFGKVISSTLLGVLASIAEVVGVSIFTFSVSALSGLPFYFNLEFLAFTVAALLLTVILTGAISVLLLMLMGGSVRNVQIISTIILILGMLASFSGLLFNLTSFAGLKTLFMFIPFVQIVAAMQMFAVGLTIQSFLYLGVVVAFSLAVLLFVIKIFNPERILLR